MDCDKKLLLANGPPNTTNPPFPAYFNILEFLGCLCTTRGLAGNARAQMNSTIGISGMLSTWLRYHNQMTSDDLKLVDFCFFLEFSNLRE